MHRSDKQFTIDTKHGSYRVEIRRDEKEGTYRVRVPAFPELATFGTSLADAKRMAKDIIELHCDCLVDEGKLIIDDTGRAAGRLPKSRVLAPA